jgi:hypothetical protein
MLMVAAAAVPHPGRQTKVLGGYRRHDRRIFVIAVAPDPTIAVGIAPLPRRRRRRRRHQRVEVDAPTPDGEVAPVEVHPEGYPTTTISLLGPEGMPQGALPLDAPVPVQA